MSVSSKIMIVCVNVVKDSPLGMIVMVIFCSNKTLLTPPPLSSSDVCISKSVLPTGRPGMRILSVIYRGGCIGEECVNLFVTLVKCKNPHTSFIQRQTDRLSMSWYNYRCLDKVLFVLTPTYIYTHLNGIILSVDIP